MYNLNDYHYDLPEERVAQQPADRRDQSRMLVLNRTSGAVGHHRFFELAQFLEPSDVLVINNTEVVPGRLLGRKESGGKAELLILNYADRVRHRADRHQVVCECLVKASKRSRPGSRIFFEQGLTAEIEAVNDNIHQVVFHHEGDFEDLLYRIGKTPLPPYIRRGEDATAFNDPENYQTVYASQKGAIAAPTAGFHFTKSILEDLKKKGIQIAEITLHIGYGTFLPVRVTDIRDHKMHTERFSISEASAQAISRAKAQGRRVVAVGTTCVRTLEYTADAAGRVSAQSGNCDLFIYPGYRFKIVDAMVTNFHLPKSTLLMLVSAFAGRESILRAYRAAIENRYRFYSYGDAMLIT